jgi:DNA-binding XRE family transcriptional regulator
MIAKTNGKIMIRVEIPESALDRIRGVLNPYKVEVLNDDELIEIAETAWYGITKATVTPAENMRAFREKFGWTQSELGLKLGNKTRHYVSAMESGKRSISKATALCLAELFGVSVEKFVG